MRAGDLDRRITLQQQVEVGRNAVNEPIVEWRTVVIVSAAYRRATARERMAAGELGAEVSSVFTVRWSHRTREVDPTWRIIFDGRVYNITGAPEEIGRREGLRIDATARAEKI